MKSKDKATLVNAILDIKEDRYKIARFAMNIINELADNLDKTNLERIKIKPALYALQNILDNNDNPNDNKDD